MSAGNSAPLDPTQSLLRWGIEHSTPGSLLPLAEEMKAGKRPDLNSDMLKAIMGTSDADRMKECVMVIEGKWVDRDGTGVKDAEVTREDKLRAWDDLEMLVEDLDNANDLKFGGLWKPIISHLTDEDEEVVLRACWVCGTAVQNNVRAQAAFLEHDPLPTLSSLLTSTSHPETTRNKAMYCLSSTLKHSPLAVARFGQLEGWKVLLTCLQDPSQTLRSKTAFLLSQLMSQATSPSTLLTSLRTSGVLPLLLSSMSDASALPTGPDGDAADVDPDYREKVLRFLVNTVERTAEEGKGGLEAEEKGQVKDVVAELEGMDAWSADELGLAEEEWVSFKKGIEA